MMITFNKKEDKMNQKMIKKRHQQAEQIEPEITRHVKNASCLCRLVMINTDHAIKSRKSYTKKVKTKMVREMLPQKAAMAKVKDLIRYTILIDRYNKEELDKHVEKIVTYLVKAGYKFLEFRNYFEAPKKSGYKGCHLYFKTQEGIIFEIQFHTSKTLYMKEESHWIYKKETCLPND